MNSSHLKEECNHNGPSKSTTENLSRLHDFGERILIKIMFSRVLFARTARAPWRLNQLLTNHKAIFRTQEGKFFSTSMADAGGEEKLSKKCVGFFVIIVFKLVVFDFHRLIV